MRRKRDWIAERPTKKNVWTTRTRLLHFYPFVALTLWCCPRWRVPQTPTPALLTNLLSANENPAEDAPLLDISTSVWKSDAPKMVKKQKRDVDGEHQEGGSDKSDGEISKESAEVPFRKFVVYGLPSVKIVVPP